jgi:hypothetical protein
MKRFLLLVVATLPLLAHVEGVVSNKTTGQPQAGATVTLMNLGGGMSSLGSVKTDEKGAFHFEHEADARAPYLVQVLHDGVTYNQMLQPGQAAQPVTVEVYNASAKAPDAKITQHMILFEPSGQQITVSESVIFSNTGNVTFQDPEGTLRIQVPEGVTPPVQARIAGPQGMPITRQAEAAKEKNVYAVKYPIRPGETRIDLIYTLPASGDSPKVASKILHSGGPVRLVAPKGVTIEGEKLTSIGTDPQTQATVYELGTRQYAVSLAGTGSLQMASSGAPQQGEAAAAPAEEDPSGGIDIAKPRIHGRWPWVVGLTFGMLAIGFAMLYKSGTPAGAATPSNSAGKPGKRA